MRISDKGPQSETEPAIAVDGGKSGQEPDERLGEEEEAQAEADLGPASAETEPDDSSADEQPDTSEPVPEADADEASDEELPAAPQAEPTPPSAQQEIPDHILETARAVIVGFVEMQPDADVARFEVSASEWMAITDDSLSNELERKLLTSAAAMCLWKK